MEKFAATLPPGPLRIADVGSCDVSGNYRNIFQRPGLAYVGLDVVAGPNVDIVLASENDWSNVPEGSFDVVISGQTLEHTRRPWLFAKSLARIVKAGGLLCVIAPYAWEYHACPIDCWRVYPEGMRAILEDAGLRIIQLEMTKNSPDLRWGGDTVAVATK
jgi:SAM-dependent methyltransferase